MAKRFSMYTPKCGNLEPHRFHDHINMHFKEVWCGGVCDWCNLERTGMHGPGEHK